MCNIAHMEPRHTNNSPVDPVAYGFESLMVNEFSGQQYPCMTYTPPYGNLEQRTQVCSAVAAVAGQSAVSGTAYLESAYQYDPANRWRYATTCHENE